MRVGARRLRALARGDDAALREWIAAESATALAFARRDAREDGRILDELQARLAALGGADYPAGLSDLKDPPPYLTFRGTLPEGGVAVIGTRDADATARAFAYALGRELRVPVVSGLARGIDTAAHRGALAAGTPTIAYVGTGLGVVYPPENAELAEEIVRAGGALASERLPRERVTTWALVRRDRLQAAHAAVTVLIASEPDGGAMHTMRFARELERPRFALAPGRCANDGGNVRALEDGAVALPWDAGEAARLIAGSMRAPAHSCGSREPERGG